jgi:hypothetical protein
MDNSKPEDSIKPKNTKRFRLGALILVVIILFVLFKVNLRKAIDSPQFKSNITFIEERSHYLFNQYLSKPAIYIWNNLFTDWLKKSVDQVKKGGPLKVETPKVDQSTFDKVIKPDKINDYFGNTSDEDIKNWTSPTGN